MATAFASAMTAGLWAGHREALLARRRRGAASATPAPAAAGAAAAGRAGGAGFAAQGRRRPLRAPQMTAEAHGLEQQGQQHNKRRMPAIARPLVPSQELREFVADEAQPRSQIIKALSAYAKEHGLQDPDDRTLVRCDAKLKSLFGVDQCTFLGMSKYLTPHLSKPEEVGGKYIEQAQIYEQNWMKDNADKVQQKNTERKGTAKRRTPASSDEARASGKGLWKPVQLSPDLAKICGDRAELPRQEILKHVWAYIREHNLQGKPGEAIRCDAQLRCIFGSETVTARSIMGGIQPHITSM